MFWLLKNNGTLSRVVNKIVSEEESDIEQYGRYLSHFKLYYHAMKEAGENTNCVDSFLIEIDSSDLFTALNNSKVPQPAIDFVT